MINALFDRMCHFLSSLSIFCTVSEYDCIVLKKHYQMSATRYKRPHVNIFICIEMTRKRHLDTKKKQYPVYHSRVSFVLCSGAGRSEGQGASIQKGHFQQKGHLTQISTFGD